MGRRPRSIAARRGLARLQRACALVTALALGGCAYTHAQFSTGGVPTLGVQGGSALGGLIAIGFMGAMAYESERGLHYRANPFDAINPAGAPPAPPLDPSRRVLEQDCSQPIADWSANLRCR